MSRRLAAALLGLSLAAPAAGQEIGRLFFTPEQRAALDARRKAKVPDKSAPVAAPTLRLDGYVKRTDGRSTIWVNGEAADQGVQPPTGVETRVSLPAGEGGDRVSLKPGETLDRSSNTVRDVIGDGELRVKRKP